MVTKRNYREEIECAFSGGRPDHIPFTAYEGHMPPASDQARAELEALGLAVCARAGVAKETVPNVVLKIEEIGPGRLKVTHVTPIGNVYKISQKGAGGSWAPIEHYIKKRDDFRVAEFIIGDRRFEPDYDGFRACQARVGDSGIVLAGAASSPLLDIQLDWIGQEEFCYQMADNPDCVESLHDTLWKSQQPLLQIVSESPAQYVNYCGNVVPAMFGIENIRRFIEPCYKTFADMLHASGKKIGTHADANNSLLLETFRRAGFDYIEAFTPPPDCDVSVEQLRRELPGTVLSINFPSSQHLCNNERIAQITRELIAQAGDRKGVLFGVTEDVPPEHMVRSYRTILQTLRELD